MKENEDLRLYKKTLHFKERYKERLEPLIGKFDAKKLNKRKFTQKVKPDGQIILSDHEINLVIIPQSKTLVTCYLTNKKSENNKYIKEYLNDIDKANLKIQKKIYNDFLIQSESLIKILEKNKNIGRTTQPKDIKIKKNKIDEAMSELTKLYSKMKNISLQIEEDNDNIHNEFKK